MAGSSALAQQLQLLILSGELAEAAPSFERMVAVDGASSQLISAYGLACAEAGRHEADVEAAARLAADPQLLVAAGMGWGQVAMCASEVAVRGAGRGAGRAAVALDGRPTAASASRCPARGTSAPPTAAWGCWRRRSATTGGRRRCWCRRRAQEHRRGAVAWERRAVAGLRAVRAARSVRYDQVG